MRENDGTYHHLAAYVRNRAKASAYERVGDDRMSELHSKRADAHRAKARMHHFGDGADESEFHMYGHSDWPKEKGPTYGDVLGAAKTGLQAVTAASIAAAALMGTGFTPLGAGVVAAGVCSFCWDAKNEVYKKGCKCKP